MISYVFLDTNNWIYLANGFNPYSNKHEDVHLKVFEFVKNRALSGEVIFLINSIILEEFDRNKSQTQAKIKDINQKIKGYIGSLKPITDFLEGDDLEVKIVSEKILKKAATRISHLEDHIIEVEDFLINKTFLIPITNDHKIAASEMALAKKAPFIGEKKNSMADALHLLSFIDYMDKVRQEEDKDAELFSEAIDAFFVSSNSGDFSAKDDRETLHPDLVPIFESKLIEFSYALNKLVIQIENTLLSHEEQMQIENAEYWWYCDLCDADISKDDFSKPIRVFDPSKVKGGSMDEKQLPLFNDLEVNLEDPYIEIREYECDCGTHYIICPNCDELIDVGSPDKVFSCDHCSYNFIFHQLRDPKVKIVLREFKIVPDRMCTICGNLSEFVTNDEICEVCLAYDEIVSNN
ncbi:PIN domain-containing protein [Pedobacter nyackensis]|uniref:PIN domain-containing protein n=1 Tax=Pedobacter nyackensis TaxID=475255 RepID=UPI00292FC98D|nr:PIN domain-containing protein [Pedobacter nyackensis]